MGQASVTQKLKMKIKINILLASLLLLAVSCSRKVALQKSHTKHQQDSSHVAIDTGYIITTESNTQIIDLGDTLTGGIYLPIFKRVETANKVFADSLESDGIKIKLSLKPVENGFKAHIKAIAKPKKIINTSTKTTTEKKGISQQTTTSKATEQTIKTKQGDKTDAVSKYGWLLILFLFLLVAFSLYKSFNKNKNG